MSEPRDLTNGQLPSKIPRIDDAHIRLFPVFSWETLR